MKSKSGLDSRLFHHTILNRHSCTSVYSQEAQSTEFYKKLRVLPGVVDVNLMAGREEEVQREEKLTILHLSSR